MRISSKASRGFSLLELLIVVAIILIIATIAVPSLLRSRQAANESAGAANMRSINVAQNAYLSTYHQYAAMTTLIADGLLDERFLGALSGYQFSIALNGTLDFTSTATAVNASTGRYDYYSSPDYVVRYTSVASRAPAGQAGLPVGR